MKKIIIAYVFAVLSCFCDSWIGITLTILAYLFAIGYAYSKQRMAYKERS